MLHTYTLLRKTYTYIIYTFLSLFWIQEVLSQSSSSAKEPFIAVDQMPEFPGGTAELYKYVLKNLRISDSSCFEEVMMGRLDIHFIVSAKGQVEFQSCKPTCAAVQVHQMLQSMPCWKPGMQSGKPVAVRYFVPMHICGSKQ